MKPVDITYHFAQDDKSTRARPVDASAALKRMNAGNQAFADLFNTVDGRPGNMRRVINIDARDVGVMVSEAASLEQQPFAIVLGCSDARVPIGLVFNEGPNDLFVVRVAGNTLGDDVRGSIDYALEHLGESLKLVVVLGHSGCGAITAAVDVFQKPADYLSLASKHTLRTVVDRLIVVVHAVAKKLEAFFGADITRHPRYRAGLIEASVITNAALAAHTLQLQIDSVYDGSVQTVYGAYEIADRTIWAPRCSSNEVIGLATPPLSEESFVEFSNAVLGSEKITGLFQ